MKSKTFQILHKYYTFDYPFYSGSSVTCMFCQESHWFTGQELKHNASNGWLKIFNHKATCQAVPEIKNMLDCVSTANTFLSSEKACFLRSWFGMPDKK
jgi:hypothetical protein